TAGRSTCLHGWLTPPLLVPRRPCSPPAAPFFRNLTPLMTLTREKFLARRTWGRTAEGAQHEPGIRRLSGRAARGAARPGGDAHGPGGPEPDRPGRRSGRPSAVRRQFQHGRGDRHRYDYRHAAG